MIRIENVKNFVESITNIDSTKIVSVTIFNYSNNNGGCYGYSTSFSRGDMGDFWVQYSTTVAADFPYCTICGDFQECRKCYYHSNDDGCVYEQDTASLEEVIGSCFMALITHERELAAEHSSDIWVKIELADEQQDA